MLKFSCLSSILKELPECRARRFAILTLKNLGAVIEIAILIS